jgi:hypothetical protein
MRGLGGGGRLCTLHTAAPAPLQPAAPPSRRSIPAHCQRSDAQAEASLPLSPPSACLALQAPLLPLQSMLLSSSPSSPLVRSLLLPLLLLNPCDASVAPPHELSALCSTDTSPPPLGPLPARLPACGAMPRCRTLCRPLLLHCVRTGCSPGCCCRCTGRLGFRRAAAQPSRLLPAAHSPSFAPQYPLCLCLMGPRGTCPCALVPCGASGRAHPPLWLPQRLQNDACCYSTLSRTQTVRSRGACPLWMTPVHALCAPHQPQRAIPPRARADSFPTPQLPARSSLLPPLPPYKNHGRLAPKRMLL